MVNTFGFRPGGPYGMLAPFGFGPPGLQGSAAPAGGYGQDDDAADVPVDGISWRCRNRDCGAHTAGTYIPICEPCNDRLKNGERITLENGFVLKEPIEAGQEPVGWDTYPGSGRGRWRGPQR